MERENQKLIDLFELWLSSKRYSDNTVKSYKEAIKVFINYFKDKRPSEITNRDILHFNYDYILRKGYSASYQNQVINAIKLFYLKVENRHISIENIERPKKYRPLPK